jgi:hypothetical protein
MHAPPAHWALVVQLVRQAFALQMYGLQVAIVTPGQLPWPSQFAGRIDVVVVGQLASRHDVVGKVQPVAVPLQDPLHGAVPVQAGCPVRGAPLMTLHVPAVCVDTLQNWHDPVHAMLQQTPSAQNPLLHSRGSKQPCPLARFAEHTPLSQKLLTQSVSATQVGGLQVVAVLHTTPPGQAAVVAVPQAPVPVQVAPRFSCEPEHTGSAHGVVTGGKWQLPLPSQVPSWPHGMGPGGHLPFDDPPDLIERHSPLATPVSAFAHEVHVPVHAFSQHRPPTQFACVHSVPSVHAVPSDLVGVQVPTLLTIEQ